ncbi:MAG TPA: hypothetical protein ENG51_18710 [Deltaproteobacteria bacterium]|nr:hypothetical protein [Deltaproteobacteria bacterium]
MKANWSIVPLGEILTERREIPPDEALLTGEIPIIAKISFSDGEIELREDGKTRTKMILIRPGDLVISGINAAKGAIAVYGEENETPIAATIHYSAYIPNKNRVDIHYLWWFLRSKPFRSILEQYLPGGIKTELRAKRFLSVPVPLPPLVKQKSIVSRITNFFCRVEEARNLQSKATLLQRTVMESAIQDIFNRFKETCPFEQVTSLKPRSGPSFPTSPDWDGTPVLMPSSVTGFGVDISKVEYGLGTETVSPLDRLEPEDIIIARGNKRDQVGNAGVVPEEASGWVCANLLMRIRLKQDLANPYFCIYWLRSPQMRTHIYNEMSGTNPNIQKINQRKIQQFPFPAGVSLKEQHRIVEYLDALQSKVDSLGRLQAQSKLKIDALFPSILDRAFAGKL